MHPHQSDHDHDDLSPPAGEAPRYYEIMETAVRELLVERGMIDPGEIRRQIEVLDSRTPALGAKVVARAWVDPGFRARLLANGRAACEELDISFYDDTQLIVLENTQTVHNLTVCTLCSCYPRPSARSAARLVQAEALPGPHRKGAARHPCRIRHRHP
jgi:hypothetical protein